MQNKKILYANNAKSTLASGINNLVTSLSIQAGAGALFPNPGAGECFIATLRDAAGNIEIVQVDTRTTDAMSNVTRGIDGSTARSWSAGDKFEVRLLRVSLAQIVHQDGRNMFAIAGGTAGAITAVFDPPLAALVNGCQVRVRLGAVNPSAIPTFSPDGLAAKTCCRPNGQPLTIGDFYGAGHEVDFRYNSTFDKWVVMNPYYGGVRVGQAIIEWNDTADVGWLMLNDGSIGDASSSATSRANADCEALFKLVWAKIINLWAPTQDSAGALVARGGSAQADWDAHRRIVLPKALGRALAVGGTGSFSSVFTAANATDTLTIDSNSSIYTGAICQVANTGGALPTGFAAATNYFAIRLTATTMKLASSLTDAYAGTAIDLTTDGTGTNKITMALTARVLGEHAGEDSHSLLAQVYGENHSHSVTDPTHAHTFQAGKEPPGSTTAAATGISIGNSGGATLAGTAHDVRDAATFFNIFMKL